MSEEGMAGVSAMSWPIITMSSVFMTELSTLASSQLIIIATECAATVQWAATSLYHKLGDGFIFSNIFLSEFKLNPRRRGLRSARMR